MRKAAQVAVRRCAFCDQGRTLGVSFRVVLQRACWAGPQRRRRGTDWEGDLGVDRM